MDSSIEKTPRLAGMTVDENGQMTMRFRSGNSYAVTEPDYAKSVAESVATADAGKVTCDAILKARNEYEAANARKGHTPIPVSGIIVLRVDPGAGRETAVEDVAKKAWDAFLFRWNDELSLNNKRLFESKDALYGLERDLTRWAYSQSGRNLSDRRPGKDIVMVDAGKPAYYYTNGRMSGKYEIWYKAIDPFSFFGSPVGNKKDIR